mmetsp:Transcript_18717/g.45036  ORF Transcript_18717/g.45036 Transcript_18717/m.45036 type:complete len:80 (+) Transcript_18717:447-686(+)
MHIDTTEQTAPSLDRPLHSCLIHQSPQNQRPRCRPVVPRTAVFILSLIAIAIATPHPEQTPAQRLQPTRFPLAIFAALS